jgi:hypothetical protein
LEGYFFVRINLPQLETQLRNLIEHSAARLFPSESTKSDLIAHFISAMENHIHPQADGSFLAPNLFIWSLHPSRAGLVQEDHTFLEGLEQAILQAGMEAGLEFAAPPVIKIVSDPGMAVQEWHIQAHINIDYLSETAPFKVRPEPEKANCLPEAFLILNDGHIFPIKKTVLNIGRSPENHVVIKEATISRFHAQLRYAHGRFTLFDLESTGGTLINGKRVHRDTLRPGDVISLAGVNLIFGQEITQGVGDTQRISE